jgi:hypothetical protein
MLQGLGVAATAGIRPRARGRAPWIAGTIAFNLATSVLFFASVNQVVPWW